MDRSPFRGSCFFSSRSVSRVLYPGRPQWGRFPDLYHLSDRPTPRHRASNPYQPVYMVFQPKRRTASGVTTGTGELLPHLLTLTLPRRIRAGRLFSSPLLYPHEYLSPESMALCAARTFLPSYPRCRRPKNDRTSC